MRGEHETCSGNRNGTSEVDSVGIGGGYHVAVFVHDDHVACSALINRGAGCSDFTCGIELDSKLACTDHLLLDIGFELCCPLLRILLADHGFDRKVIIGRVSHEGISVLVSAGESLGHDVDRLRAIGSVGCDVEVLQNVQGFKESCSAGGRTAGGVDRIASVGGGNRLTHDRGILCKVLVGQDSAETLDIVHHLVGEFTVIEALDALVGNQLQSVRQVFVFDRIADAVEEAVVGVESQRIVIGLQVGIASLDVGVPSLSDGEALSGKVDDRLKYFPGSHRAPHLKSGQSTMHDTGNCNRGHCRRIVGT